MRKSESPTLRRQTADKITASHVLTGVLGRTEWGDKKGRKRRGLQFYVKQSEDLKSGRLVVQRLLQLHNVGFRVQLLFTLLQERRTGVLVPPGFSGRVSPSAGSCRPL